ncbi:MAG: DNA-3-methyladenine glycosylase family protein [Promethearchaeota archaeon]
MKEAIDFLKKDKVMKAIIEKKGEEIKLSQSDNYFESLLTTIIYQQLSGKAAKSILQKLLALFPEQKPTPELLLKVKEEDLVAAGISRQKRGYLFSLAEKFADGTITTEKFHKMTDEEIIQELVQVKGIGRWSAQMFLMFDLGREDVFAPDDLGLRKALQINYDFDELPKPKEAGKFAERWKPYRTYASIFLWRSISKS